MVQIKAIGKDDLIRWAEAMADSLTYPAPLELELSRNISLCLYVSLSLSDCHSLYSWRVAPASLTYPAPPSLSLNLSLSVCLAVSL